MLELIPKIPLYRSYRAFGWPKCLPLNLTLNVTYHCPSRCQTCNIWQKKTDEFTLEEWQKTFKNIKSSVYWLILSGGEPFARIDLPDLAKLAYHYLKPKVINIPTNGFLFEVIPSAVKKILENCPTSQVVINFSLDGLAEKHDKIRNLEGSFRNLLQSYTALQQIKNSRLTIGVHSVVSKLNFENFPEIYKFVEKNLKPDSYITEIAEKRTELDNKNLDVFPDEKEYAQAIDFLLEKMENKKAHGLSRITRALRINYYKLTKEVLRRKIQIIPCYAGFASGQISAEGEVWSCCVRGESMGNLKDENYDFRKIWFGEKAKKLRKSIKNKECHCPLASASYTSMLMDPATLLKISYKLLIK
jgi:MoaA/NifB/PqqE/SkfB family radical SAM enzyme